MIAIKNDAAPLPIQHRQQVFSESEERKLKLKKATQAFEAIFIAQLLKSMRSTAFDGKNQENGFGKDIMMQMADEGVSKQLAKQGMLGIGKLLYERLVKRVDEAPGNDSQLKMGKVKFLKPELVPTAAPPPNLRIEQSPANVVPAARVTIVTPAEKIKTDTEAKSPVAVAKPEPVTTGPTALEQYMQHIRSAAAENKLPVNLLKSVIMRESAGDTTAVSPKGAAGLMQLMPDTAKAMGVVDPFDPGENIRGGAKYLRSLIDRFGDLREALAAYNAGPTTVERHGGVPPYAQTKNYVEGVLSDLSKAK